eukprot:gene15902-17502_t
MEERIAIRFFLFCCVLSFIQGFEEGSPINKDGDYLDYIASKRHEIEDALLSEQYPERNSYMKNRMEFYDPPDGYDDDDERQRYEDDDAEEDEERDAEKEEERRASLERELKRRKREEKIKKLKKESNNLFSPNHVVRDSEVQISHDKIKAINLKQKLKKKKNPEANSKKRDEIKQKKDHKANLVEKSEKEVDSKLSIEDNQQHESLKESNKVNDKDRKEESLDPDGENTMKGSKDSPATNATTAPSHAHRSAAQPPLVTHKKSRKSLDEVLFIVVVAACTVAGIAGLVLASYCWYRLRKETNDAPEGEYKKGSSEKKKEKEIEMTDDDKLAKGAEVYHYMHAKKQLAAMKSSDKQKKAGVDGDSSDEESDNTVYECPGLAPPGDMKVVNPLFSDTEREHSDARSDGSHVSSPSRGLSPPQPDDQSEMKKP